MGDKSNKLALNSTDYQLHGGEVANVVDFTLKKLEKKIESTKNLQQKILLEALLVDYISGQVAISWRRGLPSSIRVTKDK